MNNPALRADPLLSIRALSVSFENRLNATSVLHGIDLDILAGESIGIVGESGCGKTVTWLAALGLLGHKVRTQGSILFRGANLLGESQEVLNKVRGKKIAMIFQDPSSCLNPAHRIGSQICESLNLHRNLQGAAAKAEAIRLLNRVHIPNAEMRMNAYPHELSGGMNQRIMIAMALAGEPDLLIADEPTTALDATVQAQIVDLLNEIRKDSNMSMVVISHDLGMIADIAERIVVMYAGRIVETASIKDFFSFPVHPYSKGLIAAIPSLNQQNKRLQTIPGSVPQAGKQSAGCSFLPRCGVGIPTCGQQQPPAFEVSPGHYVNCLHATSQ